MQSSALSYYCIEGKDAICGSVMTLFSCKPNATKHQKVPSVAGATSEKSIETLGSNVVKSKAVAIIDYTKGIYPTKSEKLQL